MRRRGAFVLICLLLLTFIAYHEAPAGINGNPAPSAGEQDVFSKSITELMEVEVTSLASGTPMRSSEAPGIITVLYGQEMQAAGYLTVMEALSHVPGLYITEDWATVYRGIGMSWNSGKVLYKLNGIDASELLSQEYNPILIPMELVERIEVVRGPGSALYGRGAFLATVNIVTRDEDNKVFVSAGSFESQTAGFNISGSSGRLKASLGMYTWERKDTDKTLEADALSSTAFKSASLAPGPINDSKSAPLSGVLRLAYGGTTFRAQSFAYSGAEGVSMTGALPRYNDEHMYFYRTNQADLSHKTAWRTDFETTLAIGYMDYVYEMDSDYFLYPKGFMGFPEDMVGGPYYKEKTHYTTLQAAYKGFHGHEVLVGAGRVVTKIAETYQTTNFHPVTFMPLGRQTTFTGALNWLDEDASRTTKSLYAQDMYDITGQLQITLGARYDKHSDTEDMTTPRVSLVHSPAPGHFLKAQYARAFRPPTFLELYMRNNPIGQGNPSLLSEKIETYELGYTFTARDAKFGVTGFHSDLKDMIDLVSGRYANMGEAYSQGLEFEYRLKASDDLGLDGSLSYIDARMSDTGTPLPGSSHWLGDVIIGYRISESVNLSTALRYRSKAHMDTANNTATRQEASHKVDIALTAKGAPLMKGLSLGMGLKNALNEEKERTYADAQIGVAETGRTWWLSAAYAY